MSDEPNCWAIDEPHVATIDEGGEGRDAASDAEHDDEPLLAASDEPLLAAIDEGGEGRDAASDAEEDEDEGRSAAADVVEVEVAHARGPRFARTRGRVVAVGEGRDAAADAGEDGDEDRVAAPDVVGDEHCTDEEGVHAFCNFAQGS